MVMGHRPLTGYHVYVFIMPVVVLNLPFVYGVDWSLAGELRVFATYFALAVVWDYIWFVLNPAYTVRRFERGNVWWFEQPWIWRFPLDYYLGIGLSIVLAALAAWSAGTATCCTSTSGCCRAGGPDRPHGAARSALPSLVSPHAARRSRRPRDHAHLSAARAGRGLVGRSARSPSTRQSAGRRRRPEGTVKKWPVAAGGALAGAAGWAFYNGQTPKAQGFGTTFIGTPGEGRLMALTYDDGPNTAWTPQLLELLAKHDVKATFFTIGKYAEQEPALLREVAAAGHAIGNHTYSHVSMPLHTDETIRRELRMTTEAIEAAGVEMALAQGKRLMRPPYGRRRPGTMRVLQEEGYVRDHVVGDPVGLEQAGHDREDHAQGRAADHAAAT